MIEIIAVIGFIIYVIVHEPDKDEEINDYDHNYYDSDDGGDMGDMGDMWG